MTTSDQTTGSQQEPPSGEPGQAGNGRGGAPRLADGVELLGEYEDSGFKQPPHVARRSDGQVVQISELLHQIAEESDGTRSLGEIAGRISERSGRGISEDNVRVLVEKKLRPLGIIAAPDGSSPELKKSDPLLALKFRAALVPDWVTRALTTVFYPAFFPPVILAVIAGLVAVDVWFFFIHGVGQSTKQLIYNPILLLMVLGLVVVATAFHEIGHATACRYGGARPGVMGAGIYIVWPAFYTDVTDAYRLNRVGRLRVDLGGIYFNAIFVLAIVGAYGLTGFEPLLILILVQHMQIIQQLLPFLRLDGYYILSDLTGVPDMFTRIKPTLKSVLPGKETEDRVEELKPWVRVATTTWVLLLIPILLFVFGMMIFNAPRLFATAYDSFFVQKDRVAAGGTLQAVGGGIQMVALVLPLAGMSYTFSRVGARIGAGAWTWTEGAPIRRALVVVTGLALAGLAGFTLLPNGEYRPVQPGERGTIQDGVRQMAAIPSGRPGLTEKRERELGGAPARRAPLESGQPVDSAPIRGGDPADPSSVPVDEEAPTPTDPDVTGSLQTPTAETGAATTGPSATATEPEATETVPTETTTTATNPTTTTSTATTSTSPADTTATQP